MELAWKLLAGAGGVLHVLFFLLEAVHFQRPGVLEEKGSTAAQAEAVRVWALNQGFYNLFLAAGCLGGLLLLRTRWVREGRALALYACGFMVGAGLVLLATQPALAAAAGLQAGPPGLALVLAGVAARRAAVSGG